MKGELLMTENYFLTISFIFCELLDLALKMYSDSQSAITNPSVLFTDFNCLTVLVYVLSFAITMTMLISKLNDAQLVGCFFPPLFIDFNKIYLS